MKEKQLGRWTPVFSRIFWTKPLKLERLKLILLFKAQKIANNAKLTHLVHEIICSMTRMKDKRLLKGVARE